MNGTNELFTAEQKPSRRWHWMPIAGLLMGAFSIFLLLWVYRISERQITNFALIYMVKDIQTEAATYHLWLEEAVTGESNLDLERIQLDFDHAVGLLDTVLGGRGESGNSLISEPLKEAGLLNHSGELRHLLTRFKVIARERLQDPEKAGVGSALDQQFDAVFKEIIDKAEVLEDIIGTNKDRNQAQSRRLVLGILLAWTLIVISMAAVLWGLEARRRRAETALQKSNEQLLSQAEELKGHREYLEELVDKRTCKLWESEQQLRQLYAQLMTAQETERRRISRELHDELGQALNVMKLRLQFIGGKLRGDQGAIKEDCENLIGHAGQVIENVRRLSRDLSPSILEDLGLTAALQWLMKHSALNITSDIIDIDHLFSQDSQIMVYRIIQEALTNISKHAGAENVFIVIQRHEENLFFSVEDDGKGFDPAKVMMTEAAEKGLGLATMNERVKILRGVFDLWSQEGTGTRVTFSVPVEAAGGS